VTTRIGISMGRELVIRAARESEKRPSQPTVNDLVLQARALGVKPQSLANFQAMEALYRKALALEPGSLPAASGLATVLSLQFSNFGDRLSAVELETKGAETASLVAKVTAVDPEFPGAYGVMATLAMQTGDLDKARALLKSQAALTPKQPSAHHNLAWVAYWLAEPEEARRQLLEAIALDPKHPADVSLLLMGWVEFMRGENDAAIDWLLRAKTMNAGFSVGRDPTLAAAYAMKGDRAKADAAVAELLQVNPKFTISAMRLFTSNQSPAYAAYFKSRYEPALRKAGFPE
jgi:tetratricopeptide (TPR) repeat protein